MPKKLPYLPRFALAIIIVLALLAAAMALNLAIAEGQGFTPKYRDALIAWTTNPSDTLGLQAQLPTSTAVKFAMPTPSDSWELQTWSGSGKWHCDSIAGATQSDNDDLGRVITATLHGNGEIYLRGVEPPDFGDACTSEPPPPGIYTTVMVSKPDAELAQISRMMLIRYGAGPQNPIPAPPGYKTDTLQTADDLLYQAPGGGWTTQMLVSVAAAGVVMLILRSMAGLMIGILTLPVSAYGMVLIGYGSYWYVTVAVFLTALCIAAFATIIRRPGN